MNTININKKSTSLRLNSGLYDYIEKQAKRQNRSVNNFIETLLFEATEYQIPNAETKKAIKEVREKKESLQRFSNADDLINSIGNE
jgi:hypothetical protein